MLSLNSNKKMPPNLLLLVLLTSNLLHAFAETTRTTFKVKVNTDAQMAELVKLNLDIWNRAQINSEIHVMVSTEEQKSNLLQFLQKYNLTENIWIPDVGKFVQEKESKSRAGHGTQKALGEMSWDTFYDVDHIYAWIDNVVKKYPELASVQTIGKTAEGRLIKIVTISKKDGGNKKKNGTFIDALFHAREWVSGTVATYIINELTSKSSQYSDLLDKLDFYILPIVNVDGYAYTQTDRLWRKNRRKNDGSNCVGVDLNRNFGYYWGFSGSSKDPCADNYQGPSAFSEPESQAIRDFITKNNFNWLFYITLHCYGQYWLSSFSYKRQKPEDDDEIQRVNKCGTDALESVHGTTFTYGSSAYVFYDASGVSDDWAKGDAKIKYSYTLELRGGNGDGFILSENEILPSCEETWAGLQETFRLCKHFKDSKGSRKNTSHMKNSHPILHLTVLLLFVFYKN